MNSVPQISRWQQGKVDRAKEHFELRYGSARDSDYSEWIPIALIGPPKARLVNVQFLVDPGDPKNVAAVGDVKKEIQFYLIDKGESDPWWYAQYHCGTSANVYSNVHWGYFEEGNRDQVKRKAEASSAVGQ